MNAPGLSGLKWRNIVLSFQGSVHTFFLASIYQDSSSRCTVHGPEHLRFCIKVDLSQKRLVDIYFSKINIPNNYPEPKRVNNLFKFSAQDSDLEYLFWRSKNSPVSSELKPPLATNYLGSSSLIV